MYIGPRVYLYRNLSTEKKTLKVKAQKLIQGGLKCTYEIPPIHQKCLKSKYSVYCIQHTEMYFSDLYENVYANVEVFQVFLGWRTAPTKV